MKLVHQKHKCVGIWSTVMETAFDFGSVLPSCLDGRFLKNSRKMRDI
jgi:hypothetical protein